MKKLICIIAGVMVCLSILIGCGSSGPENVEVPDIKQLKPPTKASEIAKITTSMGTIKIRLFPDEAPKAVENFVTLAKQGYYDDLTFHNVVNNSTIQTGDPTGDGTGGTSIWEKPFEDEFHPDLGHLYGAVSMANYGKDSNTSQFFIVTNNDVSPEMIADLQKANYPQELVEAYTTLGGIPGLNGNNTVFGQVIEGMDVAKKISQVSTDVENKPLEPVVIQSIIIEKIKE